MVGVYSFRELQCIVRKLIDTLAHRRHKATGSGRYILFAHFQAARVTDHSASVCQTARAPRAEAGSGGGYTTLELDGRLKHSQGRSQNKSGTILLVVFPNLPTS